VLYTHVLFTEYENVNKNLIEEKESNLGSYYKPKYTHGNITRKLPL
jgi:hypothetical protein